MPVGEGQPEVIAAFEVVEVGDVLPVVEVANHKQPTGVAEHAVQLRVNLQGLAEIVLLSTCERVYAGQA